MNVIDKSLRKNKKGGLIKKNVGGLVGRQKKIDADGSGNITAKDFKLLRDGNKFVAKQYGGKIGKQNKCSSTNYKSKQ